MQATILKRLQRFETLAHSDSPKLLISLIQGLCYLYHLLPSAVTIIFLEPHLNLSIPPATSVEL